jgi:hypothetical protein
MTDENLVSLETCFTVGGEIISPRATSRAACKDLHHRSGGKSALAVTKNECGASSTNWWEAECAKPRPDRRRPR